MAIMLVVQLAQPPRNYQQHRVAILWKQHQLAAGSPGESHLRLGDTKKREIWGDSPTWVWCVIMISPMNFKRYTIRYTYPVFRRTQFDISTCSIIFGGWCWQAVTSAISWYNYHDITPMICVFIMWLHLYPWLTLTKIPIYPSPRILISQVGSELLQRCSARRLEAPGAARRSWEVAGDHPTTFLSICGHFNG